MKTKITTIFAFTLLAGLLRAEIRSETIRYQQGDTTLEGVFIHESLAEGPQPGVIIFHQWGGPGEYELARAKMLATLGYAVLVADVYGEGVRPETVEERSATATSYRNNRPLARERAQAALDVIKARPEVISEKIAAIGYCFGGTIALELARSGADVAAVASIHGSLNSPTPEDARNIRAAVLVQHGAIDPYVPDSEVEAFRKEMDEAGIPYTLIAYEGAVHSFTDWFAGDDPAKGAAYNADADKKSWEDLLAFLGEQIK